MAWHPRAEPPRRSEGLSDAEPEGFTLVTQVSVGEAFQLQGGWTFESL